MSAEKSSANRREFMKNTGLIAATTALAGVAIPRVHAAEDNTIQVALIGCGGRGTGAAANAVQVKSAPVKLVAMADVFGDKLGACHKVLQDKFGDKVDVPKERQFIGFDAYQKAMDCLKPGDIAIMATPPAFRLPHFAYANSKNLNSFMEKPLTVDGPTSRRMIELADEASAKNLKVAVGLMSRHSRPLQELAKQLHDGAIGDITTMRAYRMTGPVATVFSEKWPGTPSELLWQISRFHSFIWASGGIFNDAYIHVIDHCCWMKNAWPVKAQALGGRNYRNSPEGKPYVDQNFDTYSVEYIFDDGTRLFLDGRFMPGCAQIYNSFAHGTKGSAVMSKFGDCGAPSSIYKGQKVKRADLVWESKTPADESNPYQNEWTDLVAAILSNTPYSEVKSGVYASMAGNLGRFAAHTGKEVTFKELLESDLVYAPGIEKWTMDSQPPVKSDKDGFYPIPKPGIITTSEY